ncbi:MAG: 4Fe-4S binding protein [Deltaproteobacteria bacterium]|nr:4Fe-4S binding protein [Deltaproteobacteria bacterium]MBW2677647.1 4Fe-4S binding protein [Deltaproteobacteria bacterium]
MKIRHLVWLRRCSQAFFLLLFLFLVVESRLPQDYYLDYTQLISGEKELRLEQPVTFFFQADPLVWITSLISGHVLIKGFGWSLAVLILTLVFGRVFCGFICPLGTLHHLVSYFRPALTGRRLIKANQKTNSRKIKYFILILLLVSALFGLNFSGILDPIAFFYRSLALAVLPGAGIGIKEIFDFLARTDIKVLNYLSYTAEVLVSPVFGYGYQAFKTGWLIGTIFLLILFLNRIRPRFWCRTLCPLGALLGIFSRFSILGLSKKTDLCTQCDRCKKVCAGAAGPIPGDAWQKSECLMCLNCHNTCPEDAVAFKLRSPFGDAGTDMGRRAVLGGLTAGVALPFFSRLDGQIHTVSSPNLIRPPGALPERVFLTLCQRCGLCMKACPTNVINPALTEGGLAGFWTPNLIMIQGYCEYTCTLCGSVCPTGAIADISAREKIEEPVRIGSAYFDRGRCLPWSGNGPCIVCEEHCPTSPKAIYFYEDTVRGPAGTRVRVKLPQVDLKKCVGCGICENKCIVKGRPAIRVIAAGESRSVRNQILL